MPDNLLICQICLRTDRNLKYIDKKLTDLHDELCEYSIDYPDPLYCTECEHLLRKMYNFKHKCVKAMKVLKKWMKCKTKEKTPLDGIYTMLPPTTFGIWLSTNNKTTDFSYCHERGDWMNASAVPIHYTEDTEITQTPHLEMVIESAPVNTVIPMQDNKLSKAVKNKVKRKSVTNGKVHIQSKSKKPPETLSNTKIKEEMDGEAVILNLLGQDINEDLILKTEENCLTFEEITVETVNKFKNEETSQFLNEDSLNDVNEDENDNNLDDLSVKDDRDDVSVTSNDIDEINDALDDSSDSDDTELSGKKKRKTLADLVRESQKHNDTKQADFKDKHSRNDFHLNDLNDAIKNETINGECLLRNDTLAKLKSFNRDLDDIYKNSKHILPTNKKKASKRTASKNVKRRSATKGEVVKVKNISKDLDSLYEENENLLLRIKSGLPFSREKLKAEIISLFKSCGELKDKGRPIDKNFIISCLQEDKVSEDLWRLLWRNVHGRKKVLKPKAIHVFYWIQKKYQKISDYESMFDIEYLNTPEKILEEFQRRKTYECFLRANFRCDICYQVFQYKKLLTNHMELHDMSGGELTCPICKLRQKSRKSLNNHRRAHEVIYKCRLCPLVTHYRTSMMNHYNQHKGVEYRCDSCNTSYRSSSAYATHLTYIHGRKHSCTVCGDAFITEEKLKTHIQKLHQDEPPPDNEMCVQCPQCDLTFPSTEACQKHARLSHKLPPKSVKRTTPATVKKQGLTQKRAPTIPCRVCAAEGSYGWLTLHFKTDHPTVDMKLLYSDKQNNLCHICGKGFTTIYNLRTHLNKHSGSRPYPCPSCPKSFCSSMSLASHRLLHQPRSLPCSVCGKLFRSRANLYSHMQFHIGDRRYKCNICTKAFLHRSTLTEHVRGVHLNQRRSRPRPNIADTE